MLINRLARKKFNPFYEYNLVGAIIDRYFVIANFFDLFIIPGTFDSIHGLKADFTGLSSNGRTRVFGSLYHGSNPCGPTKIQNTHSGVFYFVGVERDKYHDHGSNTSQRKQAKGEV